MAFLNASGNPVATTPHMMQIDVPTEAVTNAPSAINWTAAIAAVWQLFTAYSSGNPAAIIAAIQALIKALTGG